MIYIKYLAILFSAAIVSGCVSPQYNYQPNVRSLNYPFVGSISTASVGENMLTQGSETIYEAIHVSKEIPASLVYTILPGYFLKVGENSGGNFYRAFEGKQSGTVRYHSYADPWEAIYLKNNGEICVISIFNYNRCTRTSGFKKSTFRFASPNDFQQTLIYSGKIGTKINLGYREFTESMARAAYSNDPVYDISESKEIGYKGALIEIIDATNTFIKYRVLKNFTESIK